jgi:hypothetical protein
MNKKKIFGAIFGAVLIGAVPAHASVAVLTFTGVVNFGTDGGIFGPVYLGDPYTVQYFFDTSLGIHTSTEIFGGGSSGFPSPSLGAVVTINGQSFTICGTFAGDLGVGGFDGAGQTGAGAIVVDNYGSLGSVQISQSFATLSRTFSLDTPFTYTIGPNDAHSGTLLVQNFGWTQNIPIQTNSGWLADIEFDPETVTYSVAAVPELSTWAIMLIGFAGVGVMAYRRKKNSVLAAA